MSVVGSGDETEVQEVASLWRAAIGNGDLELRIAGRTIGSRSGADIGTEDSSTRAGDVPSAAIVSQGDPLAYRIGIIGGVDHRRVTGTPHQLRGGRCGPIQPVGIIQGEGGSGHAVIPID